MCGERVCCPGRAEEARKWYQVANETSGVLTRCCRLDDVNKHCLQEFRKHWECLDDYNQQLWQCRRFERPLNKCVFESLVRLPDCPWRDLDGGGETHQARLTPTQKLEKKIPGAPENEVPVHERKRQIYAHSITTQ